MFKLSHYLSEVKTVSDILHVLKITLLMKVHVFLFGVMFFREFAKKKKENK